MPSLLPNPLGPKPKGPTAEAGLPLFCWLKAIRRDSNSKIDTLLSDEKYRFEFRPMSNTCAAKMIMARYVRRKRIDFVLTDAGEFEFYFRQRYAPQSRVSLVNDAGFGIYRFVDGFLEPPIVVFDNALAEFRRWANEYFGMRKTKLVDRDTLVATVLNRQLKIRARFSDKNFLTRGK